ncbi:MAG: AAA family ATPase [Candidatus Acidiferrum sp.]
MRSLTLLLPHRTVPQLSAHPYTNMYEHVFHFFGLRENPFHVSPDPCCYFSTPTSDAALAELILGVDAPQGLIVLTGEAGTGKSTLLNHFLNWLGDRQRSSSYVFHPRLKPAELFEFILRDFDLPCETRNTRDLLATLRQWLIRRHAVGDSPVVVVDEAQAISPRTLGKLQLLLNLQTAGSQLLHIVLAGQPKLEEELRRPELRHLHERVTIHCGLLPFSPEETSHFVESRLASTGATNVNVFAQECLDSVHTYAQGIPRTINLLCEHALIAAYAEQVKVVSPDIIRRVAEEFDLAPQHAAAEQHELAARFRRLVPPLPEERPTRVAPEHAAGNDAKAETIVVEPAAPRIRQLKPTPPPEIGPALIFEETISLAVPAINAVNAPVAAAVPTLHHIVRLIPKSAEDPNRALPRMLPVGWPGTSLGKRFVRYWKGVGASFARDWKQFFGASGPTRTAAGKRRRMLRSPQ